MVVVVLVSSAHHSFSCLIIIVVSVPFHEKLSVIYFTYIRVNIVNNVIYIGVRATLFDLLIVVSPMLN